MEEYAEFPLTRWSLVAKAGQADEAGKREALNRLFQIYLPALRAHLVFRRGVNPEDAEDLVSGFISDRIVERDLISQADKQKGRFRAFLAVSLDNYVSSRARYEHRMKRWGGAHSPLEESTDIVGDGSPLDAFDVAWARELIARAISRMKEECAWRGREAIWEIFQARVLDPIMQQKEATPCPQLVERLGFASPMQASNALATAKRMFARTLRALIEEYADENEIEDEIADLRRILARGGAS